MARFDVLGKYPVFKCPGCGRAWGLSVSGDRAVLVSGLGEAVSMAAGVDGAYACDKHPDIQFTLSRPE